jgi:SOS-response transcriptional repressor LexA
MLPVDSDFTVKQHRSVKRSDEDGRAMQARIELHPLNPEFEPIVIDEADGSELRVLGEFLRVVDVSM